MEPVFLNKSMILHYSPNYAINMACNLISQDLGNQSQNQQSDPSLRT